MCGRALPGRTGRRGRSSVYCSAACRQKAYRSRHDPVPGEVVTELIADIEHRVRRLVPQRPSVFYQDVTALSSSVGRLRRVARTALDAAQVTADSPDSAESRDVEENVTPAPVTRSTTGHGTEPGAEIPADSGAGDGQDAALVDAALVDAVRSGDEWTFAGLVEPYRRELQVHCYRMVGSYDDSEDLVQETLLRAWRSRDGFQGRSPLRAWLYRIATNACLDFLRRTTRRVTRYEPVEGMDHGSQDPPPRITWLQPYPDHLLEDLEGTASGEASPEAAAVSRETVELVYLTAIQHLPPRQRAVLILRDALGLPAAETATLLDMSLASVNSALQRARPALRGHLPERRTEWTGPAGPTEEEREILRRYMEATDRCDIAAVSALLSEDIRLTMPPNPFWFVGREAMVGFLRPSLDPASPSYFGDWRHLPTRANGQPAAAGYVRRPGTAVYRAQVLDVLRVQDGKIVEITAFEPHLFPAFGLPLKL
ncbi:hypothetical protein Psi01_00570 [Planobispora siamensis]|uniref:RNA polymerase sigma factor n=1 Tax=Planobispora siamensis TaxID=936338 RepID=A0A8J3SB23_9ACTN|nr:hypothetical protein Psi01_00570 [Planobispora siamensis]